MQYIDHPHRTLVIGVKDSALLIIESQIGFVVRAREHLIGRCELALRRRTPACRSAEEDRLNLRWLAEDFFGSKLR